MPESKSGALPLGDSPEVLKSHLILQRVLRSGKTEFDEDSEKHSWHFWCYDVILSTKVALK